MAVGYYLLKGYIYMLHTLANIVRMQTHLYLFICHIFSDLYTVTL